MKSAHEHRAGWVDALQQRRLGQLAAWWLEAVGPLNIIGAQLLYMSEPFLAEGQRMQVLALAGMLESQEERDALAENLRGQTS